MPIDPNGPLAQYRTQIDDNEVAIAERATKTQLQDNFQAIAFGGIINTVSSLFPDIGPVWQTITGFTAPLNITSVNVVADWPNNGISFDVSGVFNFDARISLGFDDINAGREISFRLYNETAATPSPLVSTFFVGRNQEGVNLGGSAMGLISPLTVGDRYVLQVYSPDSFTNVVNLAAVFQAHKVDGYTGVL